MRKIIPFLFLTLFLIVEITAQNSFRQSKLLYNNTDGEKGTSYYEYDGNNKLVKTRWQLDDTSRWSTNYYFYNKQGQLIEKYREFSDSLISSLKYEYLPDGKKSAEIFSRSDGRQGKSLFIYSNSGIPEKIVCNKFNGWFDGEIVFTKWENNNPTLADIFQNQKKIGDITYNYDDNNNLKKEFWETTGGWTQEFIWVYEPVKTTYTSSNIFISENSRFRLSKENYSYNGETGGPSFFTYSENGALTEKVFIRSDSLKTRTNFEYDKKGILKKSNRYYSDGKTGVFTYKFNEDRKLVSRMFERSDGIEGSEKYTYNSSGQLIEAEWENFDNWLTGILTFKYGSTGQIVKGNFNGEEFDAELTFSYDNYGNLSKIHWQFSFGKTQTYWFEYTQTE